VLLRLLSCTSSRTTIDPLFEGSFSAVVVPFQNTSPGSPGDDSERTLLDVPVAQVRCGIRPFSVDCGCAFGWAHWRLSSETRGEYFSSMFSPDYIRRVRRSSEMKPSPLRVFPLFFDRIICSYVSTLRSLPPTMAYIDRASRNFSPAYPF